MHGVQHRHHPFLDPGRSRTSGDRLVHGGRHRVGRVGTLRVPPARGPARRGPIAGRSAATTASSRSLQSWISPSDSPSRARTGVLAMARATAAAEALATPA